MPLPVVASGNTYMVDSTWGADSLLRLRMNLHSISFCVFCGGISVETVDNNMDNTLVASLVAASLVVDTFLTGVHKMTLDIAVGSLHLKNIYYTRILIFYTRILILSKYF